MNEIHKLRVQLSTVIQRALPEGEVNAQELDQLRPPTADQLLLLRQIITAGFLDQVARLSVEDDDTDKESRSARLSRYSYSTCMTETQVYIHPSSVLFREPPSMLCA
jgi:ATP-dependent RNA helicase DHX37/DHR1